MERKTYLALDAVRAFHLKNNQLVCDTPDQMVPYSCALLRLRLVNEEAAELLIAMHEGNLINIADGFADLKYVLLGTAVSYGIALADHFPDESSLKKIGDIDGFTDDNVQKKAFIASRLSAFVGDASKHIFLGVQACCESHRLAHNRQELCDSLEGLDELISESAAAYGIPLREVFFDVHKSNMSKNLSGTAGTGGKYGEHDNPKGEGYVAPDIESILASRMGKATLVH